jgi:hypothetical protein
MLKYHSSLISNGFTPREMDGPKGGESGHPVRIDGNFRVIEAAHQSMTVVPVSLV